MTCSYCRTLNSDEEHRCRRCGRRLTGTLSDTASDGQSLRVDGALAAQPMAAPRYSAAATQSPVAQRMLFADRSQPKVIPFESIAASRVEPRPAPSRPAPRTVTARPPARRQVTKTPDLQTKLDFLPPAPQSARKLKTTVEAVIYCDAPVATRTHRGVAAALDASMVLIAYGIFVLTFYFSGGDCEMNRPTVIAFAAAFLLIATFYGLIWLIALADSPGEQWTRLRLTNFDGFPPEASQRILRFAGTCLSLCTGGLGLLWATVDEESLAWHDHISKTFLTPRETETNFFRQR